MTDPRGLDTRPDISETGSAMSDPLTEAVAAVLDQIEPGSVATYGDVGRQLGLHPRQAGHEVSKVPDDVPWWRVIRADGTPAPCRGGRAVDLLAAEGVPLRAGRVDLARVRRQWTTTRPQRSQTSSDPGRQRD